MRVCVPASAGSGVALLVDGEVGRHGPVKSGVFGPKLVHLLLGGGAH